MCNCEDVVDKQFWERIDKLEAREIVVTGIEAAREEVEYSRALSAWKRHTTLLGESAGEDHRLKAELHFRSRNALLRDAKAILEKLRRDVGDKQEKRFAEFVKRGGVRELTDYGRQTAILRLLDSKIPYEEVGEAARQLDSSLEEINKIASMSDVYDYALRRLDEYLEQEMGNPVARDICILILVFSSVFALLLILAIKLCAFWGQEGACKALDNLLTFVCGSA